MKRLTLFLTLICLAFVPTLSAQETYTGMKIDSLDAGGISEFNVSLDNGFTVRIRGTETDRITYTYNFEGNRLAHQQRFRKAEMQLERQGATAVLRIAFPRVEKLETENRSWLQRLLGSGSWNVNTDTQELIVEMPRALSLRFSSRYSDLDLDGVGGDVTVQNRSGTIAVADVEGSLQVNNEYGNTTARNIAGNVRIESRSSDLVLREIGGSARVNSLYSNLDISQIGGEVHVQTQSGELEAERINGPLTVRADYTAMNIGEIGGQVQVQSRSGNLTVTGVPSLRFDGEYTDLNASRITGVEGVQVQNRSAEVALTGVEGPARVSGEYMEIRLEEIGGDLSVNNRSGSVEAAVVRGAARIDGEYMEIDLNDFRGNRLQVSNRSEDVNVESTGTLSEVDIRVAYGDVNFVMSEEYAGRYSLRTSYGALNLGASPFSPETGSFDPDARSQSVTGTVGGSDSNNFHIEARNGDVTVTLNR